MTKKQRSLLGNILFFGFIIFLLTPIGLPTRTKLIEGFSFVKGKIMPPSIVENNARKTLSTYDVSFKAINNAENVNLKDLSGKVVFINHWATWCPPCRAEMPSLDALYKDYKDKIIFLFVASDNKREVTKYYTKNGFDFPTYNTISSIPKEINTSSIPATFILDKKGNVALEEFGPENWNTESVRATLDALLAE